MTIQVAPIVTAPQKFGLKSLDDELHGHLTRRVPQGFSAIRSVPTSSRLGAKAVMGAQGTSEAGEMPLDMLAKSRALSGTNQLAPTSLGWERGLGDPTLTPVGPIAVTMSQAP